MYSLDDYQQIVGKEPVDEIKRLVKRLKDKHIVVVSSTYQGGGVAEMLNTLVPLINMTGLDFGWRIIHGSPDFFSVTKSLHNALQGQNVSLYQQMKSLYEDTNQRFSTFTHLDHHDLVIVHDPQPLPLVQHYPRKNQPWAFRAHIDLSHPNKEVFSYLKKWIQQYDHVVVSREEFRHDLKVDYSIIHPAIDPLSEKNKRLDSRSVNNYLEQLKVPMNKPLVTQISRYDKWKDPEGVVKVFDRVKKQRRDAHLVLLGNLAADDPEGVKVYERIHKRYGKRKDMTILVNVDDNDLVVNALQRRSDVILQKSLREGFGLTVTESLFKQTPVVASNVGGIPLQIEHGEQGYLHKPKDYAAFADSVSELLQNEEKRKRMGRKGRETVKENFLITELMKNWLRLSAKLLNV